MSQKHDRAEYAKRVSAIKENGCRTNACKTTGERPVVVISVRLDWTTTITGCTHERFRRRRFAHHYRFGFRHAVDLRPVDHSQVGRGHSDHGDERVVGHVRRPLGGHGQRSERPAVIVSRMVVAYGGRGRLRGPTRVGDAHREDRSGRPDERRPCKNDV